jgi:hypothetical protein
MMRTAIAGTRKARFSATGMLNPEMLRPMLGSLIEIPKDGKLALASTGSTLWPI